MCIAYMRGKCALQKAQSKKIELGITENKTKDAFDHALKTRSRTKSHPNLNP